MNEIGTSTDDHAGAPASQTRWWHRRLFKVLASVAFVGVVLLGVAAEYIAHHAEPILRRGLIESVEQRFHEPAELDSLSVSVVRGLEVRGSGLKLLPASGSGQPVVIVKQFAFRTSIDDLLHLRARVDTIYVEGLELHIPPHSVHLTQPHKEPHPAVKLVVHQIVCKDALIVIETDKPGKQPLQFAVSQLTLTDFGDQRPFAYEADLINPRPVGKLHVFGNFGPWNGAEPRSTSISGDYNFADADLGSIKGLKGTLQSTGHFAGVLGYVTVDGTTETPNFGLDLSGHTMPLQTRFHAYVDGTSGDTTLDPVQARLRNSWLTARGSIVRVHDPNDGHGIGHDIAMTVTMPHGRIEDLLEIGMKTQPPVMRGGATLQAKVHIPPGHVSVVQKMQIAGSLKIAGVEFTNTKLQDRIDGLSMRAQGHPDEAKSAANDRKAEVASQLDADFTLANAMMKVPSLHYEVPGARVQLDGVYSLDGEVFEFTGRVHTDAKASQMVTGWKSMLLKPLDGFLGGKGGGGLDLPLSINGVKGDVSLGFHDIHQTPDQMATQMQNRTHPSKASTQP
jgi:hypothetical protein